MDPAVIQSQLASLETSGLIRLAQVQPELEYLFRHALLQEAAYTSLLKQDRKQLHRWVGEAIERLYPERLDELSPVLANHYDEAGDGPRALGYYARAGDLAARRYANAEALMLYSRALEIASKLPKAEPARLRDIFLARGRTLELSAQYEQARANYEEMEAIGRQRGDTALRLSAQVGLALLYATVNRLFNPTLALEFSDRAASLAKELGDLRAEAKIEWILMLAYQFTGKSEEAVQHGEKSLALVRRLDFPEQLAYTLNDLGRAYMNVGRLEAGLAVLEEARGIWQSLGNLPMLAENLSSAASNRLIAGQYDQGLALAGEALRLSRETGNLWGQSYGQEITAYILLGRGDYRAGFQAMEDAIHLGRQAGNLEAMVVTPISLAYLYGEFGAYERGIRLIEQALEHVEDRTSGIWSSLMAVLASLYHSSGRIQEAEAAFEQAQSMLLDTSSLDLVISMKLAEGILMLHHQAYAGVVEKAEELIPLLDSYYVHFLLGDVILIKSSGLFGLGRLEDARRALGEAQALFAEPGSQRTRWKYLALLSQVEEGLGHEMEARRYLEQARQEVHALAEDSLPPDLRRFFLALPQVREVMGSQVIR